MKYSLSDIYNMAKYNGVKFNGIKFEKREDINNMDKKVLLQKGQKVSLRKGNPSLSRIIIGLGWEVNKKINTRYDFDLDASAYLLGANGKVTSDNDFIFYNKLVSDCRSVIHTGDNLDGDGDGGDDEQIIVDLDKIIYKYDRIAFTVTIHDADVRRQNFGQIENAYVRVLDADTENEIMRYNLPEDYSSETAMVFGEVCKIDGDWNFNAVGDGTSGGLYQLCKRFGVNV